MIARAELDHAAIGRALAALLRADARVTIATTPGDRIAVHVVRLCDTGDGVHVSGDTIPEALRSACNALGVTP